METPHPFDLQARAELAAAALTRLVDPRRDGLMYFLASWRARPPRADHGLWDCGDGSGRHIDALTLLRRMARPGSPAGEPDDGEARLEAWMLRLLGSDGLSWLPPEPWAAPWGADLLLREWRDGEPAAEVSWAQRGTLLGLTSRFQAAGDERCLAAGRALVDGLLRVAVRHPDGLFFPEGYWRPGDWRHREPGLCPGIEEYNAAVIVPAIRFHAATGYQPALELADGLARFALKQSRGYLPDGRLQAERGGLQDHFHTRSNFILGLLELGLLAGRREYVSWARQSYEHAKAWGTDFGWFPEGLGCRHGELCCTTDMLEIALGLGLAVDRAYFADAERYGRNHLIESQFLSVDALRRAVERLPAEDGPPPHGGRYSTTEGVVDSQAGGFASRAALNDALHADAPALMQCCSAAGARGLYDLWRHAVEETRAGPGAPARLAIHLRFSVETPALRVVSHEPAAGRLDLVPRVDARILARLPAGEARALAVTRHAGQVSARALDAAGGYVAFDAPAGSAVELHYGLPERDAWYAVGSPGRELRCAGHWRGETLLRMDPPGPYLPFYQRTADLPPAQPALPARPPIDSISRPFRTGNR